MSEVDKAIQAVKSAGVSLSKEDYLSYLREVAEEIAQLISAAEQF